MSEPALRPLIVRAPLGGALACTLCGAVVNDGARHTAWHRDMSSPVDPRRMSLAEFEAKYPGMCTSCGWSMAVHIAGPDVVHCPPSWPGTESPAVRAGDIAALHRWQAYEAEGAER